MVRVCVFMGGESLPVRWNCQAAGAARFPAERYRPDTRS